MTIKGLLPAKITASFAHALLSVLMGATALLSFSFSAHAQTFAQTRAETDTVSRIAFGSCVHQDRPQPIWEAVNAANPDVGRSRLRCE